MDVKSYKVLHFRAGSWPVWFRKYMETMGHDINRHLVDYRAVYVIAEDGSYNNSKLTFLDADGYARFCLEWM